MKSILQGLKSLNLLEQNLKLRAQKHLQIVSNIANFSNPDYKAFEMVLDVPGPGQGALRPWGSCCKFHNGTGGDKISVELNLFLNRTIR